MSGKICFFEPNAELAEKLVDYWLCHGLAQYTICYYSDVGKWQEDAPGLFADLWILDRSLEHVVKSLPQGNILWWTDCPEDTGAAFKYRSAAVLLHTILGHLQETRDCCPDVAGTKLISLYSPVKRCLQTTFGIHLAHLLSKKGRILYLNLEGYSGFDHMLSGTFSKDISDFIYYVNQTSENISLITQKFIYRLGEVDMIPPVLNPHNLQDITEDMWIHMLHILHKCELYDYIIIDVSDFIHGTFAILRESQVVFSLTKSNERASFKWQQYCDILEESGYRDILDKTRSPEVPHIAILPSNLEDCPPGPLMELVSKAAREAGIL
ncbi:MAG: hypothetical protein IJ274_06080 [Lachnospiraceae bacterium]|nr:hypothetical protein [Lachnospiraceae bacterium]